MDSKTRLLGFLAWPIDQIIPTEDKYGRRLLNSSRARVEVKIVVEQFRQKAVKSVMFGDYDAVICACDEMSKKMRAIGIKYVGKESTFEADEVGQWGHKILLATLNIANP